MATFNDLIEKTTVDETDLLAIRTIVGSRKLTFANFKKAQDSYFQKQGVVIWENAVGSSLISGLTFLANKRYEVITSSYYKMGGNFGKQSKIVIFTSLIADQEFIISAAFNTGSETIKDYKLILSSATGSLSLSPAMELIIYKIIQLN